METIRFTCDWCGIKHEIDQVDVEAHVAAQRQGWITGLNPEIRLRESQTRHQGFEDIYLFPKEMRQERTDKKEYHYECTLCPECVGALITNVVATRATRKSVKR